MNKILVGVNEKVYLKRLFGVSYPTVRKALNGESNSSLSLKIRKAALERGGVETDANINAAGDVNGNCTPLI